MAQVYISIHRIALAYYYATKETFVLLNGKHTTLSKLADCIRVSEKEADEFLHAENSEKTLKIPTSIEKAKARVICLLGFAGERMVNSGKENVS